MSLHCAISNSFLFLFGKVDFHLHQLSLLLLSRSGSFLLPQLVLKMN